MAGPERDDESFDRRPAQASPRQLGLRPLAGLVRRFAAARPGNVAVMFALLVPTLVLITGGVFDISSMVTAKTRLQDATDAAAMAAAVAVAKNPNLTEAQLQASAQNVMSTNASAASSITAFHVCAPIQNDCTDGAGAMQMETISMTTKTTALCYLGRFLPGVCTGAGVSQPLSVYTKTTIGFAASIEISMLLDTSGSMIVGATTGDDTKIENWVSANWALVHNTSDSSQTTPCAFACHDEGNAKGQTTVADMKLGLQRAEGVATTRYDVMKAAAYGLVQHVQSEASPSAIAQNTYMFNVAQFNDSPTLISQWDDTFSGAENAVQNNLSVGIDTDINGALNTAAQLLGPNGTGFTRSSPLKFLILVTDGLESDFTNDFPNVCNSYVYNTSWNSYAASGCYAQPITQTYCTQLKNNGIVLAVLETPYVDLSGQDPQEQLYEIWVRETLFPNGPSTTSTVSAALNKCASNGYYFQASNPNDIATGFTTLTDKFLSTRTYLQR